MTITARELEETISEAFINQITGEARSVSAVAGAPQASSTITTEIYNPTYTAARGGDRSHASISIARDDDQEQLHEWLRSYKDVRQTFQDEHVARAREFSKSNPAMGIVAARQVLEIPHRGKTNMMFMWNDGVWLSDVAEAFGKKYDYYKTHKLHGTIFDTPEKVEKEMEAIINKARRTIGNSAIQAWQEAVSDYGEIGDNHATGVSYVELGKAFIDGSEQSQAENALSSFSHGASVMIDRLSDFPLHPPVGDIVEVDELNHHLKYAVKSVVNFDTEPKNHVVDTDKIKQAVYRLDDYGVSRNFISDAYEYLGRKFPLGDGKLFFKREAKEIKLGMKTSELLDRRRVIIGSLRFRKNYRHRRP